MLKRSVHIILILLLASISLSASTWLVSTTELLREDTIFQTSYIYNSSLHPVLISTKISVNNSTFANYSYTEQQFENTNKLVSSTFIWNNNIWEKSTRTEWVYENGLLKNRKELINSANIWTNEEQVNYIYNADNKIFSEITQTYITNWKDQLKTEYNYDENNTEITFSSISENNWQPYGKIIIANNEETVVYEEFDSIWHLRTRTAYHQKSSGQTLDETQQVFQDSIWRNQAKRVFTYSTNEDINGELLLSWNTEFWSNLQRKKIETQNLETVTTYYTPLYNEWLPAYKNITFLNTDDLPNKISTEYLFWGGDITSTRYGFLPINIPNIPNLVYGQNVSITYESHENTPTNILSTKQPFMVYPNPSPNGIFYVEGNYNTISEFWVYTLQGQLIKHISNTNNQTIDISELSKGIYLSKITVNNKETFTTKLIKSL